MMKLKHYIMIIMKPLSRDKEMKQFKEYMIIWILLLITQMTQMIWMIDISIDEMKKKIVEMT